MSARRDGPRLVLAVEDSGGAAGEHPGGNGVGLRNTEDRLRCLYGAAAALVLERGAAGGARVTLTLPFALSARHADGVA